MALVTNLIAGSEARRVLLLAHGYGADERDLGGLLGYLDPEGMFATVMPRGPYSAPGAPGFSWYDMTAPPTPETFADALAALGEMEIPLARPLQPRLGEIQRLTPMIDALYVPNIDESLDEQEAKRAFWAAFRTLGDWYAAQPPY